MSGQYSALVPLILGAFRQKVEEYLEKSETNAIFKADLLTMLQVTETEEDLQTLKKNDYPASEIFLHPLRKYPQFSVGFGTHFYLFVYFVF